MIIGPYVEIVAFSHVVYTAYFSWFEFTQTECMEVALAGLVTIRSLVFV